MTGWCWPDPEILAINFIAENQPFDSTCYEKFRCNRHGRLMAGSSQSGVQFVRRKAAIHWSNALLACVRQQPLHCCRRGRRPLLQLWVAKRPSARLIRCRKAVSEISIPGSGHSSLSADDTMRSFVASILQRQVTEWSGCKLSRKVVTIRSRRIKKKAPDRREPFY